MVFLDESGHTGTIKYNTGKWNTSGQPFFVLAAVILDGRKKDKLCKEIGKIKENYKIQNEMKSTHKTVKNNIKKISDDLETILNCIGGKVSVEVVNKRYCIVINIVEYCVNPYYDYPKDQYYNEEHKKVNQIFANYIYHNISDKLLGEFCEMFDSSRKDINELINMCKKLKNELRLETINEFIELTIDSITKYEKRGRKLDNLFPLEDKYKGNISTVSICPHVDSFNDILFLYKSEKKFIHDEISDIENALIKYAREVFKKEIIFEKSKENEILQLADIIAGNVRLYIDCVLNNKGNIKETPKMFSDIVAGSTNFVAPYSEQCKLFPQNIELKRDKYYYDLFVKES